MVAAARAVGVEVLAVDAVLLEVLTGGAVGLDVPAGLMWSVVTESPSVASTRAPAMSVTGVGSIVMPSKYGGLRT